MTVYQNKDHPYKIPIAPHKHTALYPQVSTLEVKYPYKTETIL